MPIVETQPRCDTHDFAKTRRRAVARRLEDGKARQQAIRAGAPGLEAEPRDRGFEEKARSALQSSSYQAVRDVSCEVCDCVLILRGRVPSFYMKQIAQTVVRHLLDGSLVLDNQLEVDWE